MRQAVNPEMLMQLVIVLVKGLLILTQVEVLAMALLNKMSSFRGPRTIIGGMLKEGRLNYEL